MTTASRRRFAEVVRSEPVDLAVSCLLVATEAEPGLDPGESLAVLAALAGSVRSAPGAAAAEQAEALRDALGERAGFSGGPGDGADLRAALLPEVLRRRHGLPLLLSVIWVEVAHRAGIRAFALALPGRVIVGVGDPHGEHSLVDPSLGGRPTDPVQLLGRPATEQELMPATAAELLARLLANVRAMTAHQDRAVDALRTRLWAVELSLLLPQHALALRRERGELLVRLGCHLEGAQALAEYADLVEPAAPQEAELARRQARQARARLN